MAKKLAFDKALFTSVILLVGVGLVTVYSATWSVAARQGVSTHHLFFKQAFAAVLGLCAMAFAMHFDYRLLRRKTVVYGIFLGVLAMLVAVLFAPEVNGTHRWFSLSGFSFQPSELAKLSLVALLAYQIDRKIGPAPSSLNQPRLLVPCAVATALLAGLILLQPDLGTAVLLVGTAVGILFLAGLAWRYLAGGLATFMPLLYFLVMSVPYRSRRMFAFLNPSENPLNEGYQIRQSLIAVGSGGVFGRGLGESVQKSGFLPFPHSDFIFAILAEEFGLIGSFLVVALFGIVIWRGLVAGLHAPDLFGRYLAWGITSVILLQSLINISVTLALLPTKGIPLPFISYGGSSLVVSLAAVGVLLNVSEHA